MRPTDRNRSPSKGRAAGRGRGRGDVPNTALLQAAALQDHFARSLGMKPVTKRSVPKPKPLINTDLARGTEATSSVQGSKSGTSRRTMLEEAPRPNLTLAQKMGLVERPPTPLTGEQWQDVYKQFKEREGGTKRKRDDACCCPICREEFKQEDQVLLSCSHVFHRTCLASFEKFADKRQCPLCRAQFYEKRLITDGRDAHQLKCVIRIQARFRGYRTRKWWYKLLASIPPKDPDERRHWFADKIQQQTTELFSEMDATRAEADALFAEIDARHFQEAAELSSSGIEVPCCTPPPRFSTWAPLGPILSPPSSPRHDPPPPPPPPPLRGTGTQGPVINWDEVVSRAIERGDTECPICMGDLQRRGSAGVAWLSCSHVFHVDCILAFENFKEGGIATLNTRDESNSSSDLPIAAKSGCLCPVCRGTYERRQF